MDSIENLGKIKEDFDMFDNDKNKNAKKQCHV